MVLQFLWQCLEWLSLLFQYSCTGKRDIVPNFILIPGIYTTHVRLLSFSFCFVVMHSFYFESISFFAIDFLKIKVSKSNYFSPLFSGISQYFYILKKDQLNFRYLVNSWNFHLFFSSSSGIIIWKKSWIYNYGRFQLQSFSITTGVYQPLPSEVW